MIAIVFFRFLKEGTLERFNNWPNTVVIHFML